MSTFPASFGIQKLWITSTVRRAIRTGRPAGITSSLAVEKGALMTLPVGSSVWAVSPG